MTEKPIQSAEDVLASIQAVTIDIEIEEKLSMDNENVNKQDLREILRETQCPLMPSKYCQSEDFYSAFYFNGEMWRMEDNGCSIIEFKNEALKRKAMDESELMMAVDKYISYVHINKSVDIHSKLENAYLEANGEDDGDDSNDAYQKLIPTTVARIMFIVVLFSSALNGYFVISGLVTATAGDYGTDLMNNAALVMGICEVILYSNILLSDIFVNAIFLCYGLMTRNTVFLETKFIATEVRSLSTLSILRYMPSVELVTSYLVHWKETVSSIYAQLLLLFTNNLAEAYNIRTNWFKRIFSVPVYLVETLAPFLALFAILVKIKQLDFAVNGSPGDWEYGDWLTFAAFLNQVAGLRVLRKVETASIQHFVFSGADATLDTDELLLLDDWWNVTILSAVSNLRLNWFDNMVFWSSLDPQKIQLLLKNHLVTGDGDDDVLKKAKESDKILDDYDQTVFKMLVDRKRE